MLSSVVLKHSTHLSLPEHGTKMEADWSLNQPEAESASRREKSEISEIGNSVRANLTMCLGTGDGVLGCLYDCAR